MAEHILQGGVLTPETPPSVRLCIYVKNHNRNNKSDLLVEEAELLKANPQYAYVRLEDGREIPVSLRDLAPKTITSRGENYVNQWRLVAKFLGGGAKAI